MAELNEKLIACVLDHIENHPDEYEQNDWFKVLDLHQDGEYCGTKGCFAGWAVALSTPVVKWDGLPWSDALNPDNHGESWYKAKARDLLGLTRDEASRLFAGSSGTPQQNVRVIRERLRYIRTNRGLPPDRPVIEKEKVKDVEGT